MNRISGLDLLRAIAIVWVMLFHSYIVGGLGTNFDWLSRYGWAGVDMFFVLSGFLIGTQVLRPLQRGKKLIFSAFYARRAWRIMPAFFVVLALYSCFPAVREATGMQPWWQFATFTLNLFIDYSRNQAFSHAWSLCVEEHFYLIFPLLAVWLAKRPSASRFFLACAFIALSGVVLRGAVWIHDAALDPPRNWFIEDIYYPSWMRLDGLLVGVMLAFLRVYRPHQWSNLQARSGICLVAGLSASILALWIFRDRVGFIANTIGWPLLSCGFGLLVVAASSTNGLLGRFKVPGAGWLAAISYSLYLSHKIAFHFVAGAIPPTLQNSGLLLFAIYTLSTLLLGSLLYYLIELPCLYWRDHRLIATRAKANPAL